MKFSRTQALASVRSLAHAVIFTAEDARARLAAGDFAWSRLKLQLKQRLISSISIRPGRRAMVGAAAFGSLVGLAMGCAYLGGSMARTMTVKADAQRLAGAAEARFSTDSIIAASGSDPTVTDIARRHDPYLIAGAAQRDREATQFAAKLVSVAPAPEAASGPATLASRLFGLRKASLTTAPAARPYRMPGALDASRDLECLTQAVYFEARGEGSSGMQAVAQVVLNRVRHPAFPKSVCGVVFQGAAGGGCQFSFACDGSMHRTVEGWAWKRSRDVAAGALSGHVMAEVGNATHFHTTAVQPGWRSNLMRIAQVGSHVFYRFGGSAGAPDAFHFAPKASSGMDAPRPVVAGLVPEGAGAAVTAPYKILFKGIEDAAAPVRSAMVKAEEPAKAPEPAKAEAPAATAAEAVKP